MPINYGYYLPLDPITYDSIRFIGITQKTEGPSPQAPQKEDKKTGLPMWTVAALVKFRGGNQETENFTLLATPEVAAKINTIPELTPIKLVDLQGGKWSKEGTDKTNWSFQISGVEIVKVAKDD